MGAAPHRNKAAAGTTSSRLGVLKGTIGGGEIVEVQGGHIVRSTGSKDRHSKVCTAKGPRDRRVRLSAHTAIQFYDVQDRLGYDRPSKAVDWLIKKAKSAIDELAELPPWNPETLADHNTKKLEQNTTKSDDRRDIEHQLHFQQIGSEVQNLHHQQQIGNNNGNNNSSFLPTSLHSDSIADTIKSFFPTEASTETDSSSIQFHNYPPDLLSTTSSQNQDLRLSLHSFQEPMLLHHHHEQHQAHRNEHEQDMYSGVNSLGFDGGASTGWNQHHPVEIGRFQRMIAWNSGTDTGSGAGCGGGGSGGGSGGVGGGLMFNSPPPPLAHPLQPLFGQNNQLFSQRGPLQSSYTPSIRAWVDQPIPSTHDHHHHHHPHQQQEQNYHHNIPQPIHPSYISGIGFASSSSGGGFSGYRIPARIQGDDEEEEHDGIIPNKMSSASSDSGH